MSEYVLVHSSTDTLDSALGYSTHYTINAKPWLSAWYVCGIEEIGAYSPSWLIWGLQHESSYPRFFHSLTSLLSSFSLSCSWRYFLPLSLGPHGFFIHQYLVPPYFHSPCFVFLLLSSHCFLLCSDLPVFLTLSPCLSFIPTAHFSSEPLISSHSMLIWIL